MTWYEEKEITKEEVTVTNYQKAYDNLEVKRGAVKSEIENAYRKLQKKYHPDTFRRKKSVKQICNDSNCGNKISQGNKKLFNSEKCRDIYWRMARNLFIAESSYNFLMGSKAPDQPELDVCDRCGKKYPLNTRFSEFKKGKEENENYLFCSEKCYNCFQVCNVCWKTEKLKDSEIRKGIWKEKGWGMKNGKITCSDKCRQGNNEDYLDPNENCSWCNKNIYHNDNFRYSFINKKEGFCSPACRSNWAKKNNQDELLNSLKLQRHDFIENNLKELEGWNLLSAEEKQGFFDQINNSQPGQFETILNQAKKKIKATNGNK